MRSVGIAFTLAALAAQQLGDVKAQARTSSPAKARETGAIEGQVVNAITGQPLQKAGISLFQVGKPQGSSYTFTTAAGGRFAFEDIEPGTYRMSVSRGGYARMQYGAHGPGRPGTTLSLDPGQRMSGLVFRLTPQSVVTGRIMDQDGDPIPYVQVQFMGYGYNDGKRQLMARAIGSTNDLGEYRVYGLAPGRYVLHATCPNENEVTTQSADAVGGERGYPPTYYPGTTDPAGATAIDLKPGVQLRGVDLTLVKTKAVRLRGRVIHMGSQKPAANAFVTAAPRNALAMNWEGPSASTDRQGNFELHGVTPGGHIVTARGSDEGQPDSGRLELEVGSNVDNVTIEVGAGVELKGRLHTGDPADATLAEASILLQGRDSIGMGSQVAAVRTDGTFTFPNVAADHYTLRVYGLADDYYVKWALLGDKEALETGFDVTRGATGPLEIVMGNHSGQIEGVVLNTAEQPATGATVLLAPDGPRRAQLRLYQEVTTDQYGRFTARGIAPGKYKLFAWEDVESGAYQDPEFLKAVENRGKSVDIREGSRESVQLQVIQ